MLPLLDNFVKELVGLATENDTVLITSEHGMDVSGFHTERSPIVIETPFVLWGPKVKRGEDERILQIDLASTLSVLTGVSPFYNSPALPAVNLLKLSEKDKEILLKESILFITDNSETLSLEELYEIRETNMSGNGSVFVLVIITLTTFLSLLLLAYFLYNSLKPAKITQYLLVRIGIGTSFLFLLVVLLKYLSIYELVSNRFPFSANFIIGHPFSITTFFVITAAISFLLRFKLKRMDVGVRELTGAALSVFIFSGILIAENPYHLCNWLILLVPVIAWGFTGSNSWIVIFAGLLSGLFIRRVTFLNAHFQISIPDRWVIVSLFLFVTLIYFWFRNRNSHNNWEIIIKTVFCFVPGLILIICPFDVETRAILLLLLLIPVIIVSKKEGTTGNVLMAMWVVFFYLGTSDSVNHLSHLAVFPVLVAVWSVTKKSSTVTMGITVSLLIWAFYFFPGNSFDLNLMDIKDNYILGSATNVYIKKTVFVIASRYILPATVLIWTVRTSSRECKPLLLASVIFLPLFFGIGSRLAMLAAPATGDFPWVEYVRLIVICGYMFILVCAFSIFSLFFRVFNRPVMKSGK